METSLDGAPFAICRIPPFQLKNGQHFWLIRNRLGAQATGGLSDDTKAPPLALRRAGDRGILDILSLLGANERCHFLRLPRV